MKLYISLIAVISLTGCASQIMQSYIGKNVNEAILDYGPPAVIIDIDPTHKAYQWHKTSYAYVPGHSTSTTYQSATANLYSHSATVNGSSTTNTYFVPATTYSKTCLYTLMTECVSNQCIVTSYRKPELLCE